MTMEIPFRSLLDPFARQAAAHILEDGDGSESDDQDFDDERVQYAPRASQRRRWSSGSLPVRFITKPLNFMPSFWWRWPGAALLKALGLESRIPCSRPVSGCATVPSYSFTEFSTYRKRARVCGIAR